MSGTTKVLLGRLPQVFEVRVSGLYKQPDESKCFDTQVNAAIQMLAKAGAQDIRLETHAVPLCRSDGSCELILIGLIHYNGSFSFERNDEIQPV